MEILKNGNFRRIKNRFYGKSEENQCRRCFKAAPYVDMGFTSGCEVYVRKVAPLGDPVEVTLRGYELSVRKDDAQSIIVSEV